MRFKSWLIYNTVYLGGLEGVRATVDDSTTRAVFRGTDLLAANSPFHDVKFNFNQSDNIVTGNTSDRIQGALEMFFVVSS